MTRPFSNPITKAVEHNLEGMALLERAFREFRAANQIIDPIALTQGHSTSQAQQSA